MADLGNSNTEEEEDFDEDEDGEENSDEAKHEDGSVEDGVLVGLTNEDFAKRSLENREIGLQAVWSLSSAKSGNGVQQLRDNNVETYWQSDGAQPHLINIQFQERVIFTELAMYVDYSLDESYTPNRITVRAGITFQDLTDVIQIELKEPPAGWVVIPLTEADPLDPENILPLNTFLIQVCIISMHQNGRDTHIRQVKIFGPRRYPQKSSSSVGSGYAAGNAARLPTANSMAHTPGADRVMHPPGAAEPFTFDSSFDFMIR